MRVTITIDDDVHALIKKIAKREGRMMGRVLSDTIRPEMLRWKQDRFTSEEATKPPRSSKTPS